MLYFDWPIQTMRANDFEPCFKHVEFSVFETVRRQRECVSKRRARLRRRDPAAAARRFVFKPFSLCASPNAARKSPPLDFAFNAPAVAAAHAFWRYRVDAGPVYGRHLQ